MESRIKEIEEIVNRETCAWDTQDVDLFLTIFHEDMVWPWPAQNCDHDPISWELILGKFDRERWKEFYIEFFKEHQLIHNRREIKRMEISIEGNGALAVVDIDTLWRDTLGQEQHWHGRVCKVYALVEDEWKMTMHTGVLQY